MMNILFMKIMIKVKHDIIILINKWDNKMFSIYPYMYYNIKKYYNKTKDQKYMYGQEN